MKYDALVTRVVKESSVISTVYFTVNGDTLKYTAGQYISVYFEQTGKKSGKAYSLSSAPHDPELSITVKNIGEFSGLICALKPGDTLQISSPYGHFNVNDDAPIVAIAAGVGIAPVWSIIRCELEKNATRTVNLLLTAAHEDELVFRKAINKLFKQCVNSQAEYFVTQMKSDQAHNRRLAVKTDVSPELYTSARFYICGSEPFVGAMWRQLMEAGVGEQQVVTETFFESSI